MAVSDTTYNYSYDDHTSIPFKLVRLKPSPNMDKHTKAHRHNYYELFVFTGSGKHHLIDFETKAVVSQSVHIVPPGSVHLLRRDAYTKGFVLLFSRDFYHLQLRKEDYWRNEAFLSYQHFPPDVLMQTEDWKQLLQLIDFIASEVQTEGDFYKQTIGHALNLVLYLVLRNQKQLQLSEQTNVVFQFLMLLNLHFQNKNKVKDYAELLGLYSDKLNVLVKQQLGKTAGEVIKERILLESKRLLMYSDWSIKEIAYFLNMEPAPFTRWIKTQCQQSPKELRVFLRELYL